MNLEALNRFEDGARVDEAALRSVGLANGRGDGVKILGDGELTRKLTCQRPRLQRLGQSQDRSQRRDLRDYLSKRHPQTKLASIVTAARQFGSRLGS